MASDNLHQDSENPDIEEARESANERFEIFISYSHKDNEEKSRLLTHLGALRLEGLCDYWIDDQIRAGEVWAPEIDAALERARMAILLITPHYLNSNFIRNDELPKILKRAQNGLSVFPILAQPCVWSKVTWLSQRQLRPRHGTAIWRGDGSHVNEDLAAVVEEIADIIKGNVPPPPPPPPPTPPKPWPPLWVKYLLLAGGLILIAVLVAAFIKWINDGPRDPVNVNGTPTPPVTKKDPFKEWHTTFYGLDEKPNITEWDAPETWKLEPSGKNNKVRALNITGTEPGLVKFSDVEPPSDCTVDIELILAPGQRSASWLLRAQPDKQNYYLFTLTFPANKENATITGSLYAQGKNVKNLMRRGVEPLPYRESFGAGDHLSISIKLTGGEFSHTFVLTSAEIIKATSERRAPDSDKINGQSGTPIPFTFIDQPLRYASGSIGFKATEPGEKLIVKRLDITTP